MIYYNINDIVVRDMVESDPQIITDEEHAQGWTHQTVDKYNQRLIDVANGECVALVAEYKGNVAGYFNVYRESGVGPFKGTNVPELVDFGVFKKYRNRGIGNVLLQVAIDVARRYGDTCSLGVGLHRDYGAAQRMYIKRGFIPDGTGIWWNGKNVAPYADMKNDDEAAIYMTKKL